MARSRVFVVLFGMLLMVLAPASSGANLACVFTPVPTPDHDAECYRLICFDSDTACFTIVETCYDPVSGDQDSCTIIEVCGPEMDVYPCDGGGDGSIGVDDLVE